MTTPLIITQGDLLKAEADRMSRIFIKADNVKIGQLIQHPTRKKYLVALSDSEHGKVLVQPHNCTINLDFVSDADLKAVSLTAEKIAKEGDEYGIKYIGTPYTTTPQAETTSDGLA